MKNKPIKFISIILAITFLWQQILFASPDSLRAKAFLDRSASSTDKRPRRGVKRRHVVGAMVIGVAVAALAPVVGPAIWRYFTAEDTTKPKVHGRNLSVQEECDIWIKALIEGDPNLRTYELGLHPYYIARTVCNMDESTGKKVTQIIVDRFKSSPNVADYHKKLFWIDLLQFIGNESETLMPLVLPTIVDAMNDPSAKVRYGTVGHITGSYGNGIVINNIKNYLLVYAELKRRADAFEKQRKSNLIVCRAQDITMEEIGEIIFTCLGDDDCEFQLVFLPEDEDEFKRTNKLKGDLVLGFTEKFYTRRGAYGVPTVSVYDRRGNVETAKGYVEVEKVLRKKGIIGGNGLVTIFRGHDRAVAKPFKYFYDAHNHPNGRIKPSTGDKMHATPKSHNPFEATGTISTLTPMSDVYIPQDAKSWMQVFDRWESRPNKKALVHTSEQRPLNKKEAKLIRGYMRDFFRELTPSLTPEELERIVDRNMKYMITLFPTNIVGVYPAFRGEEGEGYVLIAELTSPKYRAFNKDPKERESFKATMFHEWMHQLDAIILGKRTMDNDAQSVGDLTKMFVGIAHIEEVLPKRIPADGLVNVENGKERIRECRRHMNSVATLEKVAITDMSMPDLLGKVYLLALRQRAKKLGLDDPDLYLRQVARFIVRYNIPPSAAEVLAQASVIEMKGLPQKQIASLSDAYVRHMSEVYYEEISKRQDLEEKLTQLLKSTPLEKAYAAHRLLRSSMWDLLTPKEQKAILEKALARARKSRAKVAPVTTAPALLPLGALKAGGEAHRALASEI